MSSRVSFGLPADLPAASPLKRAVQASREPWMVRRNDLRDQVGEFEIRVRHNQVWDKEILISTSYCLDRIKADVSSCGTPADLEKALSWSKNHFWWLVDQDVWERLAGNNRPFPHIDLRPQQWGTPYSATVQEMVESIAKSRNWELADPRFQECSTFTLRLYPEAPKLHIETNATDDSSSQQALGFLPFSDHDAATLVSARPTNRGPPSPPHLGGYTLNSLPAGSMRRQPSPPTPTKQPGSSHLKVPARGIDDSNPASSGLATNMSSLKLSKASEPVPRAALSSIDLSNPKDQNSSEKSPMTPDKRTYDKMNSFSAKASAHKHNLEPKHQKTSEKPPSSIPDKRTHDKMNSSSALNSQLTGHEPLRKKPTSSVVKFEDFAVPTEYQVGNQPAVIPDPFPLDLWFRLEPRRRTDLPSRPFEVYLTAKTRPLAAANDVNHASSLLLPHFLRFELASATRSVETFHPRMGDGTFTYETVKDTFLRIVPVANSEGQYTYQPQSLLARVWYFLLDWDADVHAYGREIKIDPYIQKIQPQLRSTMRGYLDNFIQRKVDDDLVRGQGHQWTAEELQKKTKALFQWAVDFDKSGKSNTEKRDTGTLGAALRYWKAGKSYQDCLVIDEAIKKELAGK
ncbi:hypothetical protein QBC35DRAFT_451874 [Podospora australis]|uniref:Uncharacterized protein n=1 Tax=Podospora australis TaxID=1536484 RepID=A0AAN6WUP7_9PEZI|nr:hypothetical protein QBC35DRAFT_451874 [Podospora australis]